ncbi:MAG: energy-coupling factor transporter ATPase [Clostridiales bacterium]|nr:energy-coupling factor transporter ATPase [Clostridiales bacterium]
MDPILETKDLCCTYSIGTPFEHVALDHVNFKAYPGEYLGIIGHTGSGKSTLIQHLNGLLKPTGGQVLLHGKDIWADSKTTRQTRFKVGLVFQYPEYQLFEETVYQDIAFGPKNMKLNKDEIDRRVHQAAYFVGLTDDILDKSPFELSGGQKRRAAIAGVIAMEPEVLILDEPTAGLDPQGREAILGNIQSFHDARNATIIIVSHSMEDMARLADRIVVINDGKIPLEGTPRQVFAQGDRLRDMGLNTPQLTQVFHRLREMGLPVDGSVYTMEEAKAALLALYREGGQEC